MENNSNMNKTWSTKEINEYKSYMKNVKYEYNRLQDRIKGSCLDIEYTGTSKRKIREANEWLIQ